MGGRVGVTQGRGGEGGCGVGLATPPELPPLVETAGVGEEAALWA